MIKILQQNIHNHRYNEDLDIFNQTNLLKKEIIVCVCVVFLSIILKDVILSCFCTFVVDERIISFLHPYFTPFTVFFFILVKLKGQLEMYN